jgi:hypothetical protein
VYILLIFSLLTLGQSAFTRLSAQGAVISSSSSDAVGKHRASVTDDAYADLYSSNRRLAASASKLAPFPLLLIKGEPENDSLFEKAIMRTVTKKTTVEDSTYSLSNKVYDAFKREQFPESFTLTTRRPFFNMVEGNRINRLDKMKFIQVETGNTWPVSEKHRVPLLKQESFNAKLGTAESMMAFREILFRWRAAYPDLYESAPDEVKQWFTFPNDKLLLEATNYTANNQ